MKRFQWGKTVFFSFFLICLFSINAPAQDYWLKTFGGMDTTEMPAGGTLKPTSDGNYILAGETNGDILITKISPSGGILWSKRYDNNQMNDYPDAIIETSDGGFLIAGESEDDNVRRLILFKLSSDLNIQWQKEIQGEFFAGLAEEEGGYIASGTFCTDTDCDGFIMKVSKENGALISLTLYGDPDIIDGILGIDKTSDGYIATGATDVTFDQDGELQSANIWVLKIKQDGTIDWQKKYGPGLGRIVKVTENGFVVGAMGVYNNNPDFLVIKIGSSGIVEWAKSYGGSGEEEIMDMLVHGDDILISGLSYSTSQNPRDGVLLKISGTDGSILWQKYIDSGYQGDELNAIALTENGYLVAGAYSINWQDILIAKLSYNGEIEQPCLIYGDASLQVTSHKITPEDTSATETELDPITLPDISLGQDDLAFITYQQCPAINYNYTLNVSLINPEYGIVWADGIYCGTDCTHSYAQGTQITLTANAYYAFTGWGGDCSGCGNNINCTIIMDSNKNCTAAFSVPPVLHTLTITKTGEGKVTSNDGRIDCGTDCTEVYHYVAYLWLYAQPGAGYVFDSWGGDCSYCSHNNYCGISIYSDKNCVANFIQSSETKNLTITKAGAGSGRVISDPGGIDCGDDCSENYLINTYVSLRAIPEPGSVFSGWLGNDDCDDGNVLMNEDRTCIALFSTQTDYWLKTFGTMDNNEASSILSLPDGSMVIAGKSNGDILLMRLNSDGNILWQKVYDTGGYEEVDSLFKVTDGYLIAARSSTENSSSYVLLKVSDDGSLIASKKLLDTYALITAIEEQTNIEEQTDGYLLGGFIFNGNDFDGIVFLISKDLSNVQWLRTYKTEDQKSEGFLDIKRLSSGGYIGAGAYDVQFDEHGELTSSKIWVVRADSNGEILWQYEYGYGIAKKVLETSDGFIVGALGVFDNNQEILLLKLNSFGEVSWAKTYDSGGSDELMDMIADTNGYIIAGRGSENGLLFKVYDNGDVQWQKYFDSSNEGDEATGIALIQDGYLFTGNFGINYQDIIIGKINLNGEIEDPACAVYGDAELDIQDKDISKTETNTTYGTIDLTTSDITITVSDSDLREAQQCPVIDYYELFIDVSGYGTFTLEPQGYNCGEGCSIYEAGTSVAITAIPSQGWDFQGWEVDCYPCGTESTCRINMNSNKFCLAIFRERQKYNLIVTKTGNGTGTIIVEGCALTWNGNTGTCTPYDGTYITLSAIPYPGSVFNGWLNGTGSAISCTGTGVCGFTITEDSTIEAEFTATALYTLSITKTGNGVVTSSPAGINCGDVCSYDYPVNTTVTLTAIPGTGWSFSGWSGDCSGTNPVVEVLITENRNCSATFTLNKYRVTVNATGNGSGNISSEPSGINFNYPANSAGNADFDHGTGIVLTATAGAGSTASWNGTCTGAGGTESGNGTSTATCTINNLTEAKAVTVTFTLKQYPITTIANPASGGTLECTPNPVNHGYNSTCTISPATGYHISDVKVDGTSKGAISTYTFTDVTSSHTIEALFAINTYTVTPLAGSGGTINPNSPQTVTHGSTIEITATANEGYHIASITGCGINFTNTSNDVTTHTVPTAPITGDCTVTATFAINKYNLTVTKQGTGSGVVNATGCTLSWTANTGTCTANHGTVITLSGVADWGSTFTGWSEGTGSAISCSGTGECSFTITSDSSVKATFTLVQAVKLLTPNGGEVIPSGGNYTIKWQAPASAVKFTLRLSMDNGLTWSTIATNVTGNSYNWSVPVPGNNRRQCFIRVVAFNASNVRIGADRSDAPFTIEVIKLTSPNGGETLTSGNTHTITWTTNQTKRPVSKVILSYTTDGGVTWKPIHTYTGTNPGSYEWTVPSVTTTRTRCRVRVVLKDSLGNTIGSDLSDGFFSIRPL